MSNYVQTYRMSDIENRPYKMGDFVMSVFNGLVVNKRLNGADYLATRHKESLGFTSHAVAIAEDTGVHWFLCNDWLKQVVAQSSLPRDGNVMSSYRKLRWNYSESYSPKAGKGEDLELFNFSQIVTNGKPVSIKLFNKDDYQVDEMLMSRYSKQWKVIGKIGERYRLKHSSGLINFRSSAEIYRNYSVIN